MGESNYMREADFNAIMENVEKTLAKYPLCHYCLGRLVAKHGVGLSNYERGLSLKVMLSFKLHRDYVSRNIDKDYLRVLTENSGDPLTRLYEKLFNEQVKPRECFICKGRLSLDWLQSIAERSYEKMKEASISRFLVGVKLDKKLREKELSLVSEFGIEKAESLKNELKREVGKLIRDRYGLIPDFDKPEAMVLVRLNEDFNYDLELIVSPILLKGIYNKRGRNISHVPWLLRKGGKKYPMSIQEYVESRLAEVFKAKEVKIHAAGREDVDARTLGTGRPLVIEVVEPLVRYYDIDSLNKILSTSLLEVRVAGSASRRDIEILKQTSRERRKIYRMMIVSSTPLTESDLAVLEERFKNTLIHQRTPTRILSRKKDAMRVRRVYEVVTKMISNRSFEAIIYCDGGLYVKEVVHCDQGRTTPCFAGVLNTSLRPVELDVLYIEH